MRVRGYLIGSLVLLAALLAPPIFGRNGATHQKLYAAFVHSYFEGATANVAQRTTKFDAPLDAILDCAPSVLLTTAVTRFYRTTLLRQQDLGGASAKLVDPAEQTRELMALNPAKAITQGMDPEQATQRAFDAGLVEVSEVGFSLGGDRALMSYSFVCGATCGNGGVVMFERVEGRWTLSDKECGPHWMS